MSGYFLKYFLKYPFTWILSLCTYTSENYCVHSYNHTACALLQMLNTLVTTAAWDGVGSKQVFVAH